MKKATSFLFRIVFLATTLCCVSAAHAVSFDWATIGNPGNAADTTGLGAVAYTYRISTTEVTNGQYTEFLNAVDPTGANALSLYDIKLSYPTSAFDVIKNTGTTDGARYVVHPGQENTPIPLVTWYDSVRFINWLNNGQGAGDTESGAYTLLGNTPTPSNGLSVSRSTGASYWLPSEDEWYKAAYHDASAGLAGTYFEYATSSNSLPVSNQPSGDPSAVNYFNDDKIANGFNDGYALSLMMATRYQV